MPNTFYKPLTPQVRSEIIGSIDENILELDTCENNGLVMAQKTGYMALRNIINALPDGYLIPFERGDYKD